MTNLEKINRELQTNYSVEDAAALVLTEEMLIMYGIHMDDYVRGSLPWRYGEIKKRLESEEAQIIAFKPGSIPEAKPLNWNILQEMARDEKGT